MNIQEVKEIKKVTVASKPKFSGTTLLFIIFGIAIIFIGYQVLQISHKVSDIKLSDDKMDYVYGKVTDLVTVLNTKDTDINYNPTEKYDFKPVEDEIVAEAPPAENNEAIKEELKKMDSDDKLKVVRDKLVDIYQRSKERDDELSKVKRSFYDIKTSVENWYNDKKGIKRAPVEANTGSNESIMNKLKANLNNFVQISKVGEDLSRGNKKILSVDQIPEMLSYAEILLEAGSLSQAAWIMEDIQSITKQPEIAEFSAKVGIFVDKYPNPNAEVQQIKDLIELIENRE